MTREEYLKKLQQTESNYDVSKRQAQRLFLDYDQEEILKKWPEIDGKEVFHLHYLGEDYLLDRKTGVITRKADGKDAGFNVTLTLMDILCYAKEGAAPSGKYMLHHKLLEVQNAASYAGEGAFQKHADYFQEHPEVLETGLKALGGIPCGKGDIAFEIPVWRDMKAIVSFWYADEDFPAGLDIYCDYNTLQYMHYETVWYMAGTMIEKIRAFGE